MADVAIAPSGPNEYRVANRQQPTYLVMLEKGKAKCLIATKMDIGTGNFAKFTGFYVESNEDSIVEGHQELMAKAEPENFVEVFIPVNRILSIRSLSYRHKKPQQ